MLNAFLICACIIFCYMSALFFVSIYKKDNSIADIGWGIGFILIALFTLFYNGLFLERHLLITLLVVMWGTRLSLHIWQRNRGKGEDPRYVRWREHWGSSFLIRSFLQVFMLQGAIMLLIATPIILVNMSAIPGLGFLDLLGFTIWFVGFFFESVADYQLYIFLQDPAHRGRIMMRGLWRYSRHPNYFGEVLIWWGIYCIALQVPYGILAIISPITITYILLFVSGIPLAEKQMSGLAEFAAYKKRTSIFIPWFSKEME